MKRIFYFLAVVCLAGAGVCAFHVATMPDLAGDAIEAVDNHDPSASGDVDAAKAQVPEAVEYLHDAGWFVLGFGVLVAVARRVR